jgi:phosphoribosylamine--glycine ligase/phosphoribosylaminoimidazole synthetase
MKVLLIGSGGREHAIALAIENAPRLASLEVAPGNAGTAEYNVDLDVTDHGAVVEHCRATGVDLVIVGPEAPLVAGLADAVRSAGVACFGPSAAAAQLEGSKAFARAFAARHGIPGPVCESFTDVAEAMAWFEDFGRPVVVKADGLAAGKGVIIPQDAVETERAIYNFLSDRAMGDAGARIVLEERIEGEELSLFGISDGTSVVNIGTAQDHKRVGEGDTGLNTGGMGAFAPVPGTEAIEPELAKVFLQQAIDGMAAEGMPYVGVLYAGVMLTEHGPRLIEYNCRFGDPEAQVLLPLIGSDVLDLLDAAARGRLAEVDVQRVDGISAATVVVAAKGYPVSPAIGVPIPAVDVPAGVSMIHAGTTVEAGATVSAGGRVLSITGTGPDLDAALAASYGVVDAIVAEAENGALFARRDIGWRHAPSRASYAKAASEPGDGDAYASAGVSLSAAAAATDGIAGAVLSTHDSRVVSGLGSFGGVFDLSSLSAFSDPLLVATTDGVGTKTILAELANSWEGVGADIVNHGINDVLVQGARPLFFLDTVAAATLDPTVVSRVVEGMADACRAADCILIGGETAEMPDVLASGAVDISGTLIGVVDRADLLPKDGIAPGNVLVGLASSGLHTNGYSLARKVLAEFDLTDPLPGDEAVTMAQALLAVHRSYLRPLEAALNADLVLGLAHITGGGFVDNLPRILPDGCGATIETGAWPRPALFQLLVNTAGLSKAEAYQIFNMGVGMVAVTTADRVDALQTAIPEQTWVIGEVTDQPGVELR